jgi:hypothetical protein
LESSKNLENSNTKIKRGRKKKKKEETLTQLIGGIIGVKGYKIRRM